MPTETTTEAPPITTTEAPVTTSSTSSTSTSTSSTSSTTTTTTAAPCTGGCTWRWNAAGQTWLKYGTGNCSTGCSCQAPTSPGTEDGEYQTVSCGRLTCQACCESVECCPNSLPCCTHPFPINLTLTGDGGTIWPCLGIQSFAMSLKRVIQPSGSGLPYPYNTQPIYRYATNGPAYLNNVDYIQMNPTANHVGFYEVTGCALVGYYSATRSNGYDCDTPITDCSPRVYLGAVYDIFFNASANRCETQLLLYVFVQYKNGGACKTFSTAVNASPFFQNPNPGPYTAYPTLGYGQYLICRYPYYESYLVVKNPLNQLVTCFPTETGGPYVYFGINNGLSAYSMSWFISE